MRQMLFIILAFIPALAFPAETKHICAVCDKPIVSAKEYYLALYGKTNYVCDPCHSLPTRCTICRLPAGEGSLTMPDGRVICRHDIDKVVRAEDEGQRIFWEARREVERITDGRMTLRSPNLTIKLFDVAFWNNKVSGNTSDKMHLEGVAVSPKTGNDFFHNVNLLSGVTRAQLAMTSAHEYTHLWINENRPASHTIDPDTLEAICELVAFKLAAFRQDSVEMERIKANTYTNGKVLALIDYEKQYGLGSVLDWVIAGKETNLDKFEVAKPKPAAPVDTASPFFTTAPVAVARAPDTLTLKGLLGNSKRRLAIINDRTFEKSEEAKVRVGDKTVMVKCVDILEKSVVIRVDGAEATITLNLEGQ